MVIRACSKWRHIYSTKSMKIRFKKCEKQWYLNQDCFLPPPTVRWRLPLTATAKSTALSLPKTASQRATFLVGVGHKYFSSCLSYLLLSPSCGQVQPRGGGSFLLFNLYWWHRVSTFGKVLLRLLGSCSHLPWLVRWWFHVRRGKLKRQEASVPLSTKCSDPKAGVSFREKLPCSCPKLQSHGTDILPGNNNKRKKRWGSIYRLATIHYLL